MIVTGERKGTAREPGLNLMTIRAASATLRWAGFPMMPQAVMLAALGAVFAFTVFGWGFLQ